MKNIKPQLRFSDFVGDLQHYKLDEIVEWKSGGTPSKKNSSYWDGDIPWISASSMQGHQFNDSEQKVTKLGARNGTTVVEKDTILLLVRGSMLYNKVPIGKVNRLVTFNQDVKAIISGNKTTPDFLLWYLLHKEPFLLGKVVGTGIGAGKLDTYDLKSLNVFIPSISEQTKIANFLNTVDKRINLLKKQKEKLEQYKKGVMQQIFPSADGQAPQIRFKDDDGNDFPDWEEMRLGAIGHTFNGLTGKTKEHFGDGKPYVQYMQIFSSSCIDTRMFGYVKINDGEKQNKVKRGDIFFTTSSETPNEIGTSSVLLEDIGDVYLNSFCFGFRPDSLKLLAPEFSQYLFRSNEARKKIIRLAQGSTRFNMSKVELMKLAFPVPTLAEQQKIASFLSAIDKKIELVNQQIEHTTTWKKGLLQKMFV